MCFRYLQAVVLGGFLLALAAGPATAAGPAEWFLRAWQTEDGLPEHTIVGLAQTPDGYLWLATHEGLFRFDGVRFVEFPAARQVGRGGGQLRLLLLDRRGRLWVARDGGIVLAITQGELERVVELPPAWSRTLPRNLVEDAEGAIWVGGDGDELCRIPPGAGAPEFPSAPGGNHQRRLAADRLGQVWFAQGRSVGIVRPGGELAGGLTLSQPVARILGARRGGIWICSGSILYRYSEGGELEEVGQLKLPAGRAELEITVLFEDRSGGLWIGTGAGGVLYFDTQRVQTVDAGLPSITAITEDSEGDVWVAARGAGLNRFRPRAAELLGVNSGLPLVAVQSVAVETNGTLWLAGQGGSLVRQLPAPGGWEVLTPAQGWTGGAVSCLAADPLGELLIGTREAGLFRADAGRFRPVPLGGEWDHAFIRSLFHSANGDWWVGPDNGGVLLRCRDGRLEPFALPPGARNVRTLAETGPGDLWAATSDGLLLHLADEGRLVDESARIRNSQHNGIRALLATEDGSLWVGYSGHGLGRLRRGEYQEFNQTRGLWDDYISQMLADDAGRLWIAGNRGIFQVARGELEAVAAGRATRLRCVVLGRGEGLPNLQATFGFWPNAVRTADGRLVLPMQTGLAVVRPGFLPTGAPPPPVKIEALRVNGRLVAAYDPPAPSATNGAPVVNLHRADGRLAVGPGVAQLDLEFTALSLASPENVAFRYRLGGKDRDWVEAVGARAAHYPDLAPGDYEFQVTACGHDGVWNEPGAALALVVRPFLWETAWFRVSAVVLAVGTFAGVVLALARRRFQAKIRRLEERQALERERTRIAQDLHDDLGAGLVEINLGSELAQDPNLSPEEVREQTREIAARAREMVTALDEIVWAVNPKHDTVASLATYFCQFAQHFLAATPVRCVLEVARDLPPAPLNAEERHSLFLAFKEALCNLVRHAAATEARLTIRAADGDLIIALGDNGRGLDPATAGRRPGADGLANQRRRLAALGGRCELTGAPGAGTTVTFVVPLAALRRGAAPAA